MKKSIEHAQCLTLCLGIWSKKDLMAAFLGISACLYNAVLLQGQQLTINSFTVSHPHTGDMITTKVNDCMEKMGYKN